MKPSSLITLFAPSQSPPPKGASSYLVSILAHVVGFAWLFFGLSHTPQIDTKPNLRRFSVRLLEVPETVPQPRQASGQSATAKGASEAVARALAADESPAPAPSAAAQPTSPVHQSQILVQPDAPPDVVLQRRMPVPTVFLWTAENSRVVKPIVQAPQQKSIVAKLRPSIEPPNREVNVADIRLASTNVTTALKSLAASTTSPIVVSAPEPVKQQIPETVLKPGAEPTPVRMMSLSDFQQQGPVAIPLANATSRPSTSNSLSTGRATNSADASHSSQDNNKAGVGSGQGSGSSQNSVVSVNKGAAGSGTNAQAGANSNKGTTGTGADSKLAATGKGVGGAGTQAAANPGPGQESGGGSGTPLAGPVTHIVLPKDGQFGVVVVGSSLAEQYPEIINVWGGRLVYSVYLHVGGGKNWILQYSVPTATGGAGNVRPDAPWPFDIVRPRFDPNDFNSDALLVHGFVNSAGHFERLALVFPTEFAKAKFLLSALQQWEFRPARQNGQAAAVEVLLIIPEETE